MPASHPLYGTLPVVHPEPIWRKSSRCSGGSCLEVAKTSGGYLIRDSKHPDQPPISLTDDQFDAFTAAITAGDFPIG